MFLILEKITKLSANIQTFMVGGEMTKPFMNKRNKRDLEQSLGELQKEMGMGRFTAINLHILEPVC